MVKNATLHQPRDPDKVNVTEARELHYWMQKFGVSAGQLHFAINKVGNHAKDVEKYLGR
jgi:hypothetical protein